ncbi:hypothetical protein [Amycolatopsis saalfeldensis]|uniref:DUF5666 domain-containing protein n=1 Tax=Amycolatopsis saalfeldensis TaxID=394193 RepID=A0A1H8RQM3_9PSEU|nr:hypothetical protein [Amycolatopsis saalfeldensis]SEO68642.1 hypothetical protein SAMN04489732_101904 [Amycolatopsis saalfeldensis]
MNDYEPAHRPPAGSSPVAGPDRASRSRRSRWGKRGTWIAAAGLTVAMVGLAGAGTASAAELSPAASTPVGGGPAAPPSDGGTTGIIDSKSASSFTLATATGVEVTVNEDSATTYRLGILPAPANVVRTGESVLVLGLVDSATITASQVTVQPFGDGGAAAAQKAGVIAFQQGVPSPTQSVGQIPTDYTEGDGTIVSGAVADKATTASQAVVPGGVVDRVVLLSDGEYEVHNISINWPHHVFVSKDFKVLGYE